MWSNSVLDGNLISFVCVCVGGGGVHVVMCVYMYVYNAGNTHRNSWI